MHSAYAMGYSGHQVSTAPVVPAFHLIILDPHTEIGPTCFRSDAANPNIFGRVTKNIRNAHDMQMRENPATPNPSLHLSFAKSQTISIHQPARDYH
jgi:hypothetical protein